jgi:hypothetical protein
LCEQEVEVERPQPKAAREEPEGDFVEFFAAGTHARGVFECVSCEHVAITYDFLTPCAACGEKLWERATWAPFRRSASLPEPAVREPGLDS